MKKYKLGFIGCGNMAKAIADSLVNEDNRYFMKKGYKLKLSLFGYDLDRTKAESIDGLTAVYDAQALVNASDIIVLSVKPQNAAEALHALDFANKIVLSIMAGVSLQTLREYTNCGKLIRVMPNLNARVQSAFNGYCTVGLNQEEERIIQTILDSFGESVRVKESDMNAVTGIAGSGPAFVFMFAKAFIDAGLQRGFDYETAKIMALATLSGSIYHIEDAKITDIDALVDSVCSKGGTTIQGVNYLREQGFADIVTTAIEKAILRAEEMERNA